MSDRTHLNGVRRPMDQAPDQKPTAAPIEDRFDAPTALLRLLVGGILVGADELRIRLHEWDTATRAPSATISRGTAPTASTPRRYALIGLLFESESRVRREFSRMRTRLERLTEEAESYYDEMYEPDARQTPLDPLLTRLDELYGAAEEALDRWAARGRSEVERSSRMARLASTSVVDELLDYMARNPEVREMVEQQASSMAGVAVGEVRGRTATADLWIERLAHRVLRRPVGEGRSDEAAAFEASQPATEAQAVSPAITPQASTQTASVAPSQTAPNVEVHPAAGSDG